MKTSSSRIPVTTPRRYISGILALNVRESDDDPTGDWHCVDAAFLADGNARPIELAGQGNDTWVDTTPSLGTLGVRDMAWKLREMNLYDQDRPVHMANFYRAIADLVACDACDLRTPGMASVDTINQWLDTPEEIALLKREYLEPLGERFEGRSGDWLERFLPTVRFQ